MQKQQKLINVFAGSLFLLFLAACGAPEVGSKDWCEDIKERIKDQDRGITIEDMQNYALNCPIILKQ